MQQCFGKSKVEVCFEEGVGNFRGSTPQKHLLPEGRIIDMERGKTLGGSSTINYNMWVRGAPEDFDRWAADYGCDGWSYEDVLPHFRAIEKMEGSPGFSVDARYRGEAGPVAVAEVHPVPAGVDKFLAACESVGAQRGDYNGPTITNVAGCTQPLSSLELRPVMLGAVCPADGCSHVGGLWDQVPRLALICLESALRCLEGGWPT
ncbi:betA [Symbiodinium natans]|uniref:BetA protein n=1 Tax=Symbiodinium natans TaxID=878477 RepID=A0A812PGK0_9DINO|nr:betA [Symbiodinium natans]